MAYIVGTLLEDGNPNSRIVKVIQYHTPPGGGEVYEARFPWSGPLPNKGARVTLRSATRQEKGDWVVLTWVDNFTMATS